MLSGRSSGKLKSLMKNVIHVKAWTWILLIFALQLAGSILVCLKFKLKLIDMGLPLLVLVLGNLSAIYFRTHGLEGRWGTLKWFIPCSLYSLFIFLLSNRTYPQAHVTINADIFHTLEYFILSLLLCWAALPLMRSKGSFAFASVVFLVGGLYALSDEIHQAFIPGRTASVNDFLLDLAGIAFGLIVFLSVLRLRERLQ